MTARIVLGQDLKTIRISRTCSDHEIIARGSRVHEMYLLSISYVERRTLLVNERTLIL